MYFVTYRCPTLKRDGGLVKSPPKLWHSKIITSHTNSLMLFVIHALKCVNICIPNGSHDPQTWSCHLSRSWCRWCEKIEKSHWHFLNKQTTTRTYVTHMISRVFLVQNPLFSPIIYIYSCLLTAWIWCHARQCSLLLALSQLCTLCGTYLLNTKIYYKIWRQLKQWWMFCSLAVHGSSDLPTPAYSSWPIMSLQPL